jgi:hypothetical protein
MGWTGHVACVGDSRGAYKVLMGRSEGRKPLGRLRNRWENNINMVLREVGRGGMDWIYLTEDWYWLRALVNAVISLRVP